MSDLLLALIVLLLAVVAVLTALLHQQRQATSAATKRAEEHWCWAELHRTEADAARSRVHVLERRYATLQSLYVDLVRRRLAESYGIGERNITWKRQRRR